MSNGQRQWKQYPKQSQDNKVLYDVRDNVESNGEALRRLRASVKLLSQDVSFICGLLQDDFGLSRSKLERKPTLSHGGGGSEQGQVLQRVSSGTKTGGIRKGEVERGRGLVDLHDQRSSDDGGNTPKKASDRKVRIAAASDHESEN